MITLSAASAVSAALTGFGSATKRDKPAGPAQNTVMFIRHAEEPTGSAAPYGITEAGAVDDRSLNVRGWTRAGALVELFDPCGADGNLAPTRPGISRPAMIFAPNPGSNDSRRSQETVTPLAAALNLEVDTRFAKGQPADLAAALTSLGGRSSPASGPSIPRHQHRGRRTASTWYTS